MTRRPQSFNEGSRRSSTTPTSGSVATCSSCPRNSCSTLLRNICRSDVSFQAKTALTFTLLSRSASTLPVLDLVFQIPEVCLNIRVEDTERELGVVHAGPVGGSLLWMLFIWSVVELGGLLLGLGRNGLLARAAGSLQDGKSGRVDAADRLGLRGRSRRSVELGSRSRDRRLLLRLRLALSALSDLLLRHGGVGWLQIDGPLNISIFRLSVAVT